MKNMESHFHQANKDVHHSDHWGQTVGQESESILDQVFRESPAGMSILLGPEFIFKKANSKFYEITGLTAAVIGKSAKDVMPELGPQGFLSILHQVYQTGEPFHGTEVPFVRNLENGMKRSYFLNFVNQPLKSIDGKVYGIVGQGYDVTELVLSRRAIENERKNFKNLFKQTPEMVCVLRGPQHVFEFVNEAHKKVLGFDATGKSVREAQPESIEVHGILDEVYRSGKTVELHEIRVTVSNRIRYFNLTYAARRDESESIIGIMILGVEVTDQVLTREKIVDSEERFRKVAEAIPQLVWVLKGDGTVSYYNQKWEEYAGCPIESTLEMQMEKSVHPDDLLHFRVQWDKAMRNAEPFSEEYRLKRKDGIFRWFLNRAVPFKSMDGKVTHWFGTLTDIEDTKRTQLGQAFLDHASFIISASTDIHATLNSLAKLAISDLADWCSIDLLNQDQLLESCVVVHKDPNQVELASQYKKLYPVKMDAPSGSAKVARTGEPELYRTIPDVQLVRLAKDSTQLEWMRKLQMHSVMIVPLKVKGKVFGTITFVLSRLGRLYGSEDLSLAQELARRAALVIENANLFEELKSAVQVRDEFLSIASHELKTPLTPIKLQLQYLEKNIDQKRYDKLTWERIKKVLNFSNQQLNRLTILIEDLLDVSRISSGKLTLNFEPHNCVELIQEIMERYRFQHPQIQISFENRSVDPVIANIDRLRIEQVIENFFSNALKYAPGKPIEISLQKREDSVRVSVRDYGIGIDQQNLVKIFDRFERIQSSQNVGGLGLGLYISRQIIEAHQGRIWAESQKEIGSVFSFELPFDLSGSKQVKP